MLIENRLEVKLFHSRSPVYSAHCKDNKQQKQSHVVLAARDVYGILITVDFFSFFG